MLQGKNVLYLFAFLEGAIVMTIELLSARMLSPYFGTGVQVWGAIIGITILSLGIGYYLGGYLSNKDTSSNKLFFIFLIGSSLMTLMPMEAKSLISSWTFLDPLISVIIITALLLMPCLILFGSTPVLIIHLLSESNDNTGKTTGNVYAISTIGGIFATFLVGFFIIPEFGITIPSIVLSLIPGGLAFILLLASGKMIVLPYLLIILMGFLSSKTKTPHSNIKIRYDSEGLLGQVMVVDAILPGQSNRILFVNRMGQTFVDLNTGEPKWSYVKYLTSVCSTYPKRSKVLLLGLGGGTLAKTLSNRLEFELTAVELDERMEQLGKNLFGMPENIKPILDDARHFIISTNRVFDIIIIDVFKGEVPPSHLFTKECFEQIKEKLSENGMLLINFNGFLKGKEGMATRSLYKTLLSSGLNVNIMPTHESPKYRNCIFVCPKSKKKLSEPKIPLTYNFMEIDIASAYLSKESINLQEASIFTDDMPKLEHYNIAAAKIWREEYHKSYTNLLTAKGIRLFK